MARRTFPTWKRLLLSCGCIVGVGSNVDPAAVTKCPDCQVKVTAVLEPAPVPVVESPSPVIVPPDGGQALLPI